MRELAVLESFLESVATVAGHHSRMQLRLFGTAGATPRRTLIPIQILMSNGHRSDRWFIVSFAATHKRHAVWDGKRGEDADWQSNTSLAMQAKQDKRAKRHCHCQQARSYFFLVLKFIVLGVNIYLDMHERICKLTEN
jgi:hypothetical protein